MFRESEKKSISAFSYWYCSDDGQKIKVQPAWFCWRYWNLCTAVEEDSLSIFWKFLFFLVWWYNWYTKQHSQNYELTIRQNRERTLLMLLESTTTNQRATTQTICSVQMWEDTDHPRKTTTSTYKPRHARPVSQDGEDVTISWESLSKCVCVVFFFPFYS